MDKKAEFDLIVVGAGPSGLIAAIVAARRGKKVLVLEKLEEIGTKLRATGGGRCNLSNQIEVTEFVKRFGREGKFIIPAINLFGSAELQSFFSGIGVECHAPDGFHVFPVTHRSETVIEALEKELKALNVKVCFSQITTSVLIENKVVVGVKTKDQSYSGSNVLLCTGGPGYPMLGSSTDGMEMAKALGHKITPLYPAMLPLFTKESWVKNCRSDTISGVEIKINLPKVTIKSRRGDLIFTVDGLRGPVILDFAREITPLLEKYKEVPILVNLSRGNNEESLRVLFKESLLKLPDATPEIVLKKIIPAPLIKELCKLVSVDYLKPIKNLKPSKRDELLKILAWTPLTITGNSGFKAAMITRGGVSLKEVDPKTLKSRIIEGLYFAGEILNIDGPCGGFNLQWAFSSGYIVGQFC